ncbi:MAG: hypothetical protein IT327_15895 [Anaerolineae bacterium]|nr:hypothetical protein [Anaerolineae bacterium]
MFFSVLYWLKERLRDAWLWPLNLVRDFPARSGRLARTIFVGVTALGRLPFFMGKAARAGTLRCQLRHAVRQSGIWLHLFLVQLFDLVGGPEICQFVMHLGLHTTPLTAAELTAVQPIFGPPNLRYQDVRIAQGGILHLIFRYNGGLAFATWYTIHLPVKREGGKGTAVSSRQNLPLLVHELTHVFQYHHVGSRYLGEAIYYLVTTSRNCYQYGGRANLRIYHQQGQRLRHFNREQQAQIIQDYFTQHRQNQDTSAYEPFLVQLRQRDL